MKVNRQINIPLTPTPGSVTRLTQLGGSQTPPPLTLPRLHNIVLGLECRWERQFAKLDKKAKMARGGGDYKSKPVLGGTKKFCA